MYVLSICFGIINKCGFRKVLAPSWWVKLYDFSCLTFLICHVIVKSPKPEFRKILCILQVQDVLDLATTMQETESGQNQRRTFNKAVGPEKNYKINKPRAYVYSGI